MRGKSRLSKENFLSYCAEKLCRGTLPCFTNFLVSKRFMDKRGRREYHDFSSNFFCLTVPKIFVGEPFSVSLISGIEKFYAYEGNITTFFKTFVVSLQKNFVAEHFCASKFLVWKKFMDRRGEEEGGNITIFRRKFFVSQCQKFS